MSLRANRPRRIALLLVSGLVGLLLVPTAAQGDTVTDKQAEAQRLQAAIDANGQKADALSEQINGAQYRLDQAQAQKVEAQARIDAAQAQSDELRGVLALRAVQVYKTGGNSTPLDVVNVSDVGELSARRKYASAASNHDNSLVDQLAKAREELAAQQAQYEEIQLQAAAERDQLRGSKREIDAANAKQQELLGQVKGEIATLVRQEQARRESEARARATQLTAPRSGGGGGRGSGDVGSDPGSYPAPSGGAAAAIAFARAQIGKPYVYAAAGPDSYDCSGLTMRAWEAGGVSMPHYSGAQYDMFPHVPLSALQPGDLVFWGPGGSSHVALYIGGGTVISAPQTGDVVRYRSIYGSPVGAARPG